jgi:hypothetical protein
MDKYLLNLAGEYRVCSELLTRGLYATVTYGNKKAADIYVIGEKRRTAAIEVKASNSARFVTGFYQKYRSDEAEHPDFRVLCSLSDSSDRFFVLSHAEMQRAQCESNFNGQDMNWREAALRCAKGVDNVQIKARE